MTFDLKNLLKLFMGKKQKNDIICNLNKSKKLFFTGHEELTISASNDVKADEISKLAYAIMQKYMDKPHLILHFIASKGTKIAVVPQLLPLLKFLGYDEGFLPKATGIKAAILNFAVQITLKEKPDLAFCAPDLFIACKKDLSLYFLAYQFHHWLSYMHKLPGYDTDSMNLFRCTFNNSNANVGLLSINQILGLKDTIERDRQALDFVQKFVREQVGAKQRLNSILSGEKVKI